MSAAEWFAATLPTLADVVMGDRAAEHRWRALNRAAFAAGCRCGRPAVVATFHDGTVGRVLYESWTCAEHEGAAGWSNSTPFYSHPSPCPRGDYRGTRGPIGGSLREWFCEHRTHEAAR